MYIHLTQSERCQIYALNKSGNSLRSIARDLNRSASTISREVLRNLGLCGYRYVQAQGFADERRRKASCNALKMTKKLKQMIYDKLANLQWSPEQISGVRHC